MSDNVKTVEELFVEAVTQKRELTITMGKQMKADVINKKLTNETIKHQHMALDNFDAALLELREGISENAFHYYGRGCWNLGEFKGRASKERGLPS